jgi:hypothetical protein
MTRDRDSTPSEDTMDRRALADAIRRERKSSARAGSIIAGSRSTSAAMRELSQQPDSVADKLRAIIRGAA